MSDPFRFLQKLKGHNFLRKVLWVLVVLGGLSLLVVLTVLVLFH